MNYSKLLRKNFFHSSFTLFIIFLSKKDKVQESYDNGLEQGKIEICKEMLNNGVDIELIAKTLNVSVSEAKSILLNR